MPQVNRFLCLQSAVPAQRNAEEIRPPHHCLDRHPDELSPENLLCRALSSRNDEPEKASRPWDKSRDGFVMGEGAGVLCMESLEHAQARGANILCEYLGGATNCDAYHMTVCLLSSLLENNMQLTKTVQGGAIRLQ